MVKKVTFECEVITPMFMAGANGRKPELRPSEFKGMMRFWWRAAKAMDNIPELRREEAKIFGGTGEGEGKSKVAIRLKPFDLKVGNNITSEVNMKDLKGMAYILYSTFALKVKGERLIRGYIKTKSKFFIHLLIEDRYFSQILASFWLSIYLGGFGTSPEEAEEI